MAAEKTQRNSARGAGRHSALGRGLGALIPTQVAEPTDDPVAENPLDILFPARPSTGARARGGSAKDLLVPKGGSSKKAKRTSVSTSKATAGLTKDASSSVNEGKPSSSALPSAEAPAAATAADFAQATDGAQSAGEKEAAEARTPARSAEGAAPAAPTGSSRSKRELFEDVLGADVSRETSEELLPVPGATFAEIPLDYIVPNTKQPREVFDEDELAELRDSIREVGVLQPIVVRPIDFSIEPGGRLAQYLAEKPKARFELIMGERRLRASELAGLETVPAIIRQTEDQDLLRDALLENLHRAQLNPLEEASAYQQLMADFGATQEQLSKRIARSRPQIANTLRLLKLPPSVQKKVAAQVISAGHARALLSLETAQEMELLAERIVAEGLSVRTTEELVRLGRTKAVPRSRAKRSAVVSPLGESVVAALQDAYETRVTITEGAKKGRIVIEFAGPDDLRRIADLIAAKR